MSAASDWLCCNDGVMSPEMQRYVDLEDLGFGMASPAQYHDALVSAGFESVALLSRNAWYAGVAREELERFKGPERENFATILGSEEAVAEQEAVWAAMSVVLDSGELCPHHLRARRPD